MAVVLHIKPALDLGVAIERDDVVSHEFIVVPNRMGFAIFDPRRLASLFAKVKPFPVGGADVPFDDASRTARELNASLRAPRASRGGEAVSHDDVVVAWKAKEIS